MHNLGLNKNQYYQEDKILFGAIQKDKDINEWIMNFPKMSNLTKSEYEEETKRRQQQSANYAVQKIDKKRIKNN